MVEFKIGNKIQGMISRLKTLETEVPNILEAASLEQADQFIKIWQDGIEHNNKGLKPLQPTTIEHKRAKGLSKPEVPLYGQGYNIKDKTIINALRIKKLKNSYKVYISHALHHESKMPLSDLLYIHEHGATIRRGGKTWKIPARPIWSITYRDFQAWKKKSQLMNKVKQAMLNFVKLGKIKKVELPKEKGTSAVDKD